MKRIFTIISFLFLGNYGFSQTIEAQSTTSAGGHFVNSSVQISWSIGEPIIETFNVGDQGILTQGIHQPSFIISGVEDNLPQLMVKIFPNPTSEKIFIEFEKEEKGFHLQLYTLEGRLVYEQKIQNQKMITIDFTSYPNGLFLLSIINKNQMSKSYKIIKK